MKHPGTTLFIALLGTAVVAITIMSAAAGTWFDRNIYVVSLGVFLALCWIFR